MRAQRRAATLRRGPSPDPARDKLAIEHDMRVDHIGEP